ncbi:MAG: tyrosine-type recombinase/integrase [Rhodobacteraceae bacterium]|nr:tyrosine-type recombinase/integrase [Paracoccaceae bacterium]
MALSEFKISKAKPKEKPYKLADGGGLFLLVNPGGSKLWRQKYRHLGKERLLSHGHYPDITLAQARSKRDEARVVLSNGQDPALIKKLAQINAETQARTTFKLIAEEYIENMEERGLAPTTMKKKRWFLLDLASPLHNRPINEITSAELLYLLKSIEKSGRRETAKKMRGAISAVFRLAVVTLRAETDPTYAIKDALIPPKVTSRAAITDVKKFGALLRDLEEFTGWRIIVDALKFQILTMTRPGEVRGAKKQEVDLAKRTWTIPPERMKMRREHIIPLSDQAISIVKDNWPEIEGVELLFPSLISNRKWLSENAFNSSLRRMGYQKEEVTAHGFRATASTILNSRDYEPDVIEAALAHQDKNVIRRTYNRATYFTQRVKLMQEWADLVDEFRDKPK